MCWKILHARLPIEDRLIARGMPHTSICHLCYNAIETTNHLFLDCPYVCVLCIVIGYVFGMLVPRGNGSIIDMFEAYCVTPCSSQIHPLWIYVIISVFSAIWHSRNNLISEETMIPSFTTLRFVLISIKEIGIYKLGHYANSQSELLTLRHFSIQSIAKRPVTFIMISPGVLGWGGVFRNCMGLVLACFALSFVVGFSFEAELCDVMHAMEVTCSKGWSLLWLESDSSYVVHLFRS